jgi:hypothetical protein
MRSGPALPTRSPNGEGTKKVDTFIIPDGAGGGCISPKEHFKARPDPCQSRQGWGKTMSGAAVHIDWRMGEDLRLDENRGVDKIILCVSNNHIALTEGPLVNWLAMPDAT